MRRSARGAVVVVAVSLALAACGGDDKNVDTNGTKVIPLSSSTTSVPAVAYGSTPCPEPDGSSKQTLDFDDGFEQCIVDGKSYTATFDTSEGKVVVELDTERTPHVTSSFVALSRFHYYDDTLLFRTDTSIGIIQGGAPHTNDQSDPGPGFTLLDEGGKFTYEAGQLVMARKPLPDSSGAQFFFTVDDKGSSLDADGTYIVFGKVTEGLDVLEAILALDAPDPETGSGRPSRDVTIKTVTIAES